MVLATSRPTSAQRHARKLHSLVNIQVHPRCTSQEDSEISPLQCEYPLPEPVVATSLVMASSAGCGSGSGFGPGSAGGDHAKNGEHES